MRLFIYLLLFLFAFNLVLAENIYSGSIFSGDSFSVKNDTYVAIGTRDVGGEFANNYSKVILRRSGVINTDVIIPVGKCIDEDHYSYCFDSLTYDFNNPRTTSSDTVQPLLDIRIEHNLPSITVDNPAMISVDYGEEYSINHTFSNTGYDSLRINYKEQVPQDIIITSADNLVVQNNLITKTFTIPENSTMIIGYKIKYLGYTNKTWKASYDYDYEGNNYLSNATPITLSINTPFGISDTISAQEITKIDDRITYSVIINNIDPSKTISSSITTNINGLQVDRLNNLKRNDVTLEYTGKEDISPGNFANYTISGLLGMLGNHSVDSVVKIQANNEEFSVPLSKTFRLKMNPLNPTLLIDKSMINPGDIINITLIINNSDTINDYFQLNGYLRGISEEYMNYQNIMHGNGIIIERLYQVPIFNATSQKNILFSFDGVYKTKNAEDIRLYIEKSVPINTSYYNTSSNNTISKIAQVPALENNSLQNNKSVNASVIKEPVQDKNVPAPAPDVADGANKDFLSRIFDGINNFIKKLFGSK